MKKKKVLLGSGFAAVVGIFALGFKNCKRIKRWFKNDLHLHRMKMGCRICETEKICSKCYKCEDCKTNRCRRCKPF